MNFSAVRDKIRGHYLGFINSYPRIAKILGFTRRRGPLIALFVVIMHSLGFYYSIQAIMQTRSPRGAVAWAVSLNAFPYAAVPAYWIFGGNDFDEYVQTLVKRVETTRPIAESLIERVREIEGELGNETENDDLFSTLESLTGLPANSGNRVELFTDGESALNAIFESVSKAEKYVLIEFYIIRDDETGGRLKDALVAKAREGVPVYVLYDDYGCLDLDNAFIKQMTDAGVNVSSFMNLDGQIDRLKLNYRNHRKIVVVDGEEAFVGGVNVGDEYTGKHPKYTPWRDSHMRLRGPIVTSIQVPFIEDWQWAKDESIAVLDWEVESRYEASEGDSKMICVPTGPGDDLKTCSLFYQALINSAKERIWISTPYFVPDESIISALQLADARGVEVKLLIPSMLDSMLVSLSSQSYLEDFNGTGVEVHQYKGGFLHQKAVLVDDDFSSLGSANLDNRSLALNFEVMIGIDGADFAKRVEAMLIEDFAQSEQMFFKDLQEKSFYHRLKVRVSRLLAPIQ